MPIILSSRSSKYIIPFGFEPENELVSYKVNVFSEIISPWKPSLNIGDWFGWILKNKDSVVNAPKLSVTFIGNSCAKSPP